MIGYLLDTNIISRLIVQERNARAHLDAVVEDEGLVYIPTIAIAEIYEGMMRGGNNDPSQEERVHRFCESYEAIDFSKTTIPDYAILRAELFRQHATKKPRGYKEKVLEQLCNRTSEPFLTGGVSCKGSGHSPTFATEFDDGTSRGFCEAPALATAVAAVRA